MNKLLLAIPAIAAALSTATPATAQEKTSRQFNNELEAQVSVSRDQIKILTAQIVNNANEKYAHADYRAKMRQFAARVNERMAVFDRYLADELLPILNKCSSIANSNDYVASQKAQMLNATLQIINKKITPEYQSQIKELYNIFAEFPAMFKRDGVFMSVRTIGGDLIAVPYQAKPDVDLITFSKNPGLYDYFPVFLYVQDLLSEGCKSYSCVTLTQADYSTLLAGIKSKLDKNLVTTLADGTVVSIAGLGFDIATALRLMNSSDYTDDILNLPFESK